MKMLIAIQFWEGDREASIRLARYLSDLEQTHSTRADILLVNRFDCRGVDAETIKTVSRKFNVYTYKTRSRVTGWPNGCNAMWVSTMEWVRSMCYGGKIPPYKMTFACEGDGAPIPRDWVSRMHAAWDRANSFGSIIIAGPLVGSKEGPVFPHINGNAMISGTRKHLDWLLKTVPTVRPMVGWDYAMRDIFPKMGQADLPEIKSYYNTKLFSREQYAKMISDDLVWVHGDKSGCLVEYGRERFMV